MKGEDLVCVAIDEEVKETPVLNDEERGILMELAEKVNVFIFMYMMIISFSYL